MLFVLTQDSLKHHSSIPSNTHTLYKHIQAPLQLGDPQAVLSAVLHDRQQRHAFALLQRGGLGGDGPHLGHLEDERKSK